MRLLFKSYMLAFGLTLALPLLALAVLVFETIDRPLALDTLPGGINDSGTIVGSSDTAAGIETGFRESGGKFTSIIYPAASNIDTNAGGINNSGVIVGTHDDATEDECFIRDTKGIYHNFQPFASANDGATDCNGINAFGDTVGSYEDNTNFFLHGWVRTHGGKFTQLDVPFTGASDTEAFGINSAGDIVGTFTGADGATHGFKLDGGVYTQIDFPGTTVTSTDVYTINDKEDIGGSYTDESGDHGFVRKGDTVFTYMTVDVPISGTTTNKVTGINNKRVAVGVYSEDTTPFAEHGFEVHLP